MSQRHVTWHCSRRKWTRAGLSNASRRPNRWWGRSSNAWQVRRGMWRERRLSWVTLLSLTAGNPWCAYARTQCSFGTHRQIIYWTREILQRHTGRYKDITTKKTDMCASYLIKNLKSLPSKQDKCYALKHFQENSHLLNTIFCEPLFWEPQKP